MPEAMVTGPPEMALLPELMVEETEMVAIFSQALIQKTSHADQCDCCKQDQTSQRKLKTAPELVAKEEHFPDSYPSTHQLA